ncbi:peroxide stress protein YaaA [Riemerella columbina]|uniref:peroxide stress protein YaaA n=1 Tax=Riemerella columbina TaxID=103810 RepID=UPI00035DA029|nr:peroxide stress protein YaaA [Riemerella columbina]
MLKIVSSPAKLMTVEHQSKDLKPTTPQFIKEAELIQSHLKQKSPEFLSELMNISTKLADENWERNQNWNAHPSKDESAPALFAFTGEVYRGLDALSLDAKAIDYLQRHFRMLSGLYGLLKPSDQVMLYRLEMGRPFKFEDYKNLYSFWKDRIVNALNEDCNEDDILLNLASNEYFKAVDQKQLKAKVINFKFYELKDGKLKTIVVYTKHARGLLIRYCAEQQVKTLEDVKAFNYDGYLIDEAQSDDNTLVFVR